jgi:rhodanese-related sulfurtransferase
VTGRLFRQVPLLLGLALLPAVVHALLLRDSVSWNAPAVREGEVQLAEAQSWGDTVLWVDARPDADYEQAHIPGAVLLNEDRWNDLLPQMLGTWSPDKRVVVYCSSQSCAASHEVARRLKEEAQLPQVYVLHGGWEIWQAAQQP